MQPVIEYVILFLRLPLPPLLGRQPGLVRRIDLSCDVMYKLLNYLYSGLGQVDLQGHLFAHEYVRVSGFGKQRFQHVQLRPGERGPLASLLPRISN